METTHWGPHEYGLTLHSERLVVLVTFNLQASRSSLSLHHSLLHVRNTICSSGAALCGKRVTVFYDED